MPCFGTEHTAGAESLIKIHRLRLSAFVLFALLVRPNYHRELERKGSIS